MNTRKGISPLIATLLLIAIAVAASVLTYSWVMSMVGSQSAQAQTQVRIDSVNWFSDGISVMIRNTGSVAATLESITIRPNTAGSATVDLTIRETGNSYDTGFAAARSALCDYTLSKSYVLRVTTTTGFYYESVVTSPSATPDDALPVID